jgi:hypothetical protein
MPPNRPSARLCRRLQCSDGHGIRTAATRACMSALALCLTRLRLAPGTRRALPAAPRVVYVLSGDLDVALAALPASRVAADTAWHSSSACEAGAGAGGATCLVWELTRDGVPEPAGDLVLAHAIDLDPAREWLMRADRVEFAPAGVALPHGHKGGGIRCLLAGSLLVSVGDRAPRLMRPGDAWFESGREPVLARADADAETVFVRVSILPQEIRGESSIVYVDPADAARGTPRRYTVYVDEPITLRV